MFICNVIAYVNVKLKKLLTFLLTYLIYQYSSEMSDCTFSVTRPDPTRPPNFRPDQLMMRKPFVNVKWTF